jgi:hypothetical protein
MVVLVWNKARNLSLHSVTCKDLFLGEFVNLQKASISFVMSVCLSVGLPVCLSACLPVSLPVCPSVCPSVRPHGTTRPPLDVFTWSVTFQIFRKSVEKIQVSLKYDNNVGYFTWTPCAFMTASRRILLRMRNVSDKICTENQNTHFIFSNFLPTVVLFEIMWKNTVHPDRPQMTIYTTPHALCMLGNLTMHALIVSPRQRWGMCLHVTFIRTLPVFLYWQWSLLQLNTTVTRKFKIRRFISLLLRRKPNICTIF